MRKHRRRRRLCRRVPKSRPLLVLAPHPPIRSSPGRGAGRVLAIKKRGLLIVLRTYNLRFVCGYRVGVGGGAYYARFLGGDRVRIDRSSLSPRLHFRTLCLCITQRFSV